MNKSQAMSRVRGKNTQPELLVRRLLSSLNVRYRLHFSSLPGKPDLYVARCRTAIFVNGCFWHQHGCRRSARPKSNGFFWATKLDDNLIRDARVRDNLKQLNIRVLDLWTCEATSFQRALEGLAREYTNVCLP
jgi:DNA mismatch endonuclease (patch repair protein)